MFCFVIQYQFTQQRIKLSQRNKSLDVPHPLMSNPKGIQFTFCGYSPFSHVCNSHSSKLHIIMWQLQTCFFSLKCIQQKYVRSNRTNDKVCFVYPSALWLFFYSCVCCVNSNNRRQTYFTLCRNTLLKQLLKALCGIEVDTNLKYCRCMIIIKFSNIIFFLQRKQNLNAENLQTNTYMFFINALWTQQRDTCFCR